MKHSHSLRIVTCLLSVLLMGSLLASCGEVPEETSVTTEGIAQTYKAIVCVDDQTFEIADAEAFRRTLCNGVGRAKAFGCGLLTVAPLPQP